MAIEIERKYKVHKQKWETLQKGEGKRYQQGYLSTSPQKTVRVRLAGDEAFLTIKGEGNGLSRPEYEYAIPPKDAVELLTSFCDAVVTKIRYRIVVGNKIWEVDEFLEGNAGLLLAEIELESEDEEFHLPEWAAEEVTGDKRYYNSYLAQHPFSTWNENLTG